MHGEIHKQRSLSAIVLCGGNSRRMGRSKAWLPFDGETLLTRTVRIIAEVVEPVIVVAGHGQDLPPLPQTVRIVRDEGTGRGPLQALVTGLTALPSSVESAYVTGCDSPFLVADFIRRLADLLGNRLACVPDVAGRRHPLASIYRREVLPTACSLLDNDDLRLLSLLDKIPTRLVHEGELFEVDPTFQSLRNLNTPEDYEAAIAPGIYLSAHL